MKKNARELRSQREQLIIQAGEMVNAAEGETRDFTQEEQTQYDGLLSQAEGLLQRAERIESLTGLEGSLGSRQAPALNRIPRGDSEIRAMAHYVRTGDIGGVRELSEPDSESQGPAVVINLPSRRELRAVDSTMNITTAADGGSLVPTGFAGAIVARRNEIRLTEKLGCLRVPGKGTTVNYPYDNAEPVVLATTAEQDDAHAQSYQRDTPVIGTKAFTLVKKTKKVELTEEILDDEDVGLMDFLADWMGRNIGLTHNTLLLTEVAANGTSLKTFAAAAAIAAGEPESIVFNNALGFYLDDGGAVGWVMRNPTFGAIASITGNPRLYAQTPGGSFEHELLGYDVSLSTAAAAIAASAKSCYFGNWFYVGFREEPALRLIRDPYSVDGLVILKYSFRTVYGVLQAAAVGYGVHPSA
ncbi:MAG TPA: phage major capsid protein [Anaerolineales bacterium]|nr:phage major capsid protein [Anaerolineales bacterium]